MSENKGACLSFRDMLFAKKMFHLEAAGNLGFFGYHEWHELAKYSEAHKSLMHYEELLIIGNIHEVQNDEN